MPLGPGGCRVSERTAGDADVQASVGDRGCSHRVREGGASRRADGATLFPPPGRVFFGAALTTERGRRP